MKIKMPTFKVNGPNKDYHKVKDEDMQLGYELGMFAATLWNCQKNPGKVYVGGFRVHHGEVGIVLQLFGMWQRDSLLIGLGKALEHDDRHDRNKWFMFEKK
jgi:hypothetical protein